MRRGLAAGARLAFPPSVVAVTALACELPHEHALPLSRLSLPEINREAVRRGLVASVGDTTLWRWLSEDAIRPWNQRTWIFPRAPDFPSQADHGLELYEGSWMGRRLGPHDCVLSTDEKTSLQVRRRIHATLPVSPCGSSTNTNAAACWAVGMGAQDACLRSGIAQVVSMNKRGRAFGAFNGVFGVAWFVGSLAMGKLLDHSLAGLVAFGTAFQFAAAVAFFALQRPLRAAQPAREKT